MNLLQRCFPFLFMLCALSSSLFSQQKGEPPATPPDPARLRAHWWSYYDVDREQLPGRIEKTEFLLGEMSQGLTPVQRDEAVPLMQQFLLGLKQYQSLLQSPLILEPAEAHMRDLYTFSEFLDLLKALSNRDLVYHSIAQQIEIEKTNLSSDTSHLDDLFAAYLALSKSDPSRIIKGLKVMALKVGVELDQIKIKRLTVEAEQILGQKQALEKEIFQARQRVSTEQVNPVTLKQRIDKAQSKIFEMQAALMHSQKGLMEMQGLYANETILNMTLKKGLAEMDLIQEKLILIMYQVLAQGEKKGIKELYTQLSELMDHEKNLKRELEDWSSGHKLYLELALTEQNAQAIQLAQENGVLIQSIRQTLRFNSLLFDQTGLLIKTSYLSWEDRITEYWESFALRFKLYSQWSHKSLFKIGETPITLYGILKVIFSIVLAYFLAKFVQLWINRFGKKQKRIQQAGIYTLGRLTYYVIFIVGIIIGISGIGLDFTAFAVIAGALSLGIGFGLQSIVNNFVSGIIVLLEKKLRVGDIIQLETGEKGRVIEINVRTTLIRNFDNLEVLVPNADLVSKKFINWTLSDRTRRLRIPFSVAYGTDKHRLREVVVEAAKKVPVTLEDREPQVWLSKMGDSSLDFELVVWVNESRVSSPPMGTQAWYTWEIESALRESDISIPFPQRVVHMEKSP